MHGFGMRVVAMALVAGASACGLLTTFGDYDTTAPPASVGNDAASVRDGALEDRAMDAAPPPNCEPPRSVAPFRYVFVTAVPLRGTFALPDGGAADDAGDAGDAGDERSIAHDLADEHCKSSAEAAALLKGKTWRAWLSTPALSAVDHAFGAGKFSLPTDVRRFDGTLAFAKGYDFDGATKPAPLVPLNITETCAAVGTTEVWTGSDGRGNSHPVVHCGFWQDGAMMGGTGWVSHPNAPFQDNWTETGFGPDRRCTTLHRIYCFEAF
jgi:hypothetical protein